MTFEAWKSGPVLTSVWQQTATFCHPIYRDGSPVLVGDLITCTHLAEKYKAPGSKFCVIEIHCERRGEYEVPHVVVGNPYAFSRNEVDDIIFCTQEAVPDAPAYLDGVQRVGRMPIKASATRREVYKNI